MPKRRRKVALEGGGCAQGSPGPVFSQSQDTCWRAQVLLDLDCISGKDSTTCRLSAHSTALVHSFQPSGEAARPD